MGTFSFLALTLIFVIAGPTVPNRRWQGLPENFFSASNNPVKKLRSNVRAIFTGLFGFQKGETLEGIARTLASAYSPITRGYPCSISEVYSQSIP